MATVRYRTKQLLCFVVPVFLFICLAAVCTPLNSNDDAEALIMLGSLAAGLLTGLWLNYKLKKGTWITYNQRMSEACYREVWQQEVLDFEF